jgi:hypothetical protein
MRRLRTEARPRRLDCAHEGLTPQRPLQKPACLTGSDECGLITGVGSRVFHHGMMARRAGERGERMFGVMGEVSVGRG